MSFPNLTIYEFRVAYYDFEGHYSHTETHLFTDATLDDRQVRHLDELIAAVRARRLTDEQEEDEG